MARTVPEGPTPTRRQLLGRGALAVGSGLASASAAGTAAAPPPTAPGRPPPGYNILFVLVDQERYFDRWPFPVPGREYLTRNGVTFANHQVASQVCSAARSVVYTGQHIQHTGVFDNMEAPWQRSMGSGIATVGRRLHALGYHAAYQGKWHLSANLNEAKSPVEASLPKNNEIIASYGFADFLGVGDLIDGPLGGYSYDDLSVGSAVSWLRIRGRELNRAGRPWFMAVNLVNPHDVMFLNSDRPGERVQGSGRPAFEIKRPPANDLYRAEWNHPLPTTRHQPFSAPGRPAAHLEYQRAQNVLVGQWPDEDRRWKVLQDYYFNCIRDCDRRLVQVLEELRANGLDKSTIVVFTADHGELGGAHQMRGKGANAFKEQNHVPLIILHPAYPGGMKTSAVSSQLDLVPTLLALTGQPAADIARAGAGLKGRDVSGVLTAPGKATAAAVRPAALFNYNMISYLDASWLGALVPIMAAPQPRLEKLVRALLINPDWRKRGAIRSVFDGRYRFSRYFSPVAFNRPTTYEDLVAHNDLEIFDHWEDPDESRNLALEGRSKAALIMALNESLNARIDEEVGLDDGRFLPIWNGRWLPEALV